MKFDKNLSALHSYLCADGYVIKNPETQKYKYYHIGLRNTNLVLLKDFQERFKQKFNLVPHITNEGRCRIQNKELYYFLTKDFSYYSYEWAMPKLSRENQKIWLRAFYDCEGWVTIEKAKNRRIGMDSVNKKGIIQIKNALERLGINSKLRDLNKRKIFRLYIYGKTNLIKFQKEINFLHPAKKEKLNQAINSYMNYNWKFPKDREELRSFIFNLLKEKMMSKRPRITSIKKENLILLKKYLKQIFKIKSVIYYHKRYYELNINKKQFQSFQP